MILKVLLQSNNKEEYMGSRECYLMFYYNLTEVYKEHT